LNSTTGIDESKIEEVLESFKESEAKREREKEKAKTWKVILKFFVHGFAFSLLFSFLFFIWVGGLAILVSLGSFIGLIIAFGLLMLIIGFVNYILTPWLWFPVKAEFWDILIHGLVLFIILLIVNAIFITIPSLIFPGIVTTITTSVVGSFIDGYVARFVAGWWKTEREGISEAVKAEWLNKKL